MTVPVSTVVHPESSKAGRYAIHHSSTQGHNRSATLITDFESQILSTFFQESEGPKTPNVPLLLGHQTAPSGKTSCSLRHPDEHPREKDLMRNLKTNNEGVCHHS
jgi:hypothetical protein